MASHVYQCRHVWTDSIFNIFLLKRYFAFSFVLYVQAMEKDTEATFLTRLKILGIFRQHLKTRLELRQLFKKKPEILEVNNNSSTSCLSTWLSSLSVVFYIFHVKTKFYIVQIPVNNPLFIIGIPRSGTTFLNWFLSCDKQFRRVLLIWKIMCGFCRR